MTPADLTKALQAATPGQTIDATGGVFPAFRVPAKAYGDVIIEGGTFTAPYISAVSGLAFHNTKLSDAKFTNSHTLFLDHCELTAGNDGADFSSCTDVTVDGCNFHHLTADGMHVTSCSHVTINGCTFSDFSSGSGVHSDAIQFFVGGAKVASDHVTITKNLLDLRHAPLTQGINLSNENMAFAVYDTIVITDNCIVCPMTPEQINLGIGIWGKANVTIAGNIVTSGHGAEKRLLRTDSWNKGFTAVTGNEANGVSPGSTIPWGTVIAPYATNADADAIIAAWRARP